MAQVEAAAVNTVQEAVTLPPGLNGPNGASFEEFHLTEAGTSNEARLGAIHAAVMEEVDSRLASKTDELWSRGRQAMAQMQQSQRETASRLTEELTRVQEKQRALEMENDTLRAAVQDLFARLALLLPSPAGTGKDSEGEERELEESTAPGSSPSLNAVAPSTPRSDAAAGFPMLVTSGGSGPRTPVTPTTPVLPPPVDSAAAQQRPPAFVNSLMPSAPFGCAVTSANFTFTLRKADGVELGLHVSHHEHDKAIRVEGIKPEGAIGAWNRQWTGSCASADKIVMVGDKIVAVNGISNDAGLMLEECKNKQLLRVEIMRGDPGLPAQFEAPVGLKSTGLRAEAVAFVPASELVDPQRSAA